MHCIIAFILFPPVVAADCYATARVAYIFDTSGSIELLGNTEGSKEFSKALLKAIEKAGATSITTEPQIDVAVITFGTNATILRPFRSNETMTKTIDKISKLTHFAGATAMDKAFVATLDEFKRSERPDVEDKEAIILFTDGVPNDRYREKTIELASAAKQQGIVIYSIYYPAFNTSRGMEFLREHIATAENYSFSFTSFKNRSDYEAIFEKILKDICKKGNVQIPPGDTVSMVPPVVPQPTTPDGEGDGGISYWLVGLIVGIIALVVAAAGVAAIWIRVKGRKSTAAEASPEVHDTGAAANRD